MYEFLEDGGVVDKQSCDMDITVCKCVKSTHSECLLYELGIPTDANVFEDQCIHGMKVINILSCT